MMCLKPKMYEWEVYFVEVAAKVYHVVAVEIEQVRLLVLGD